MQPSQIFDIQSGWIETDPSIFQKNFSKDISGRLLVDENTYYSQVIDEIGTILKEKSFKDSEKAKEWIEEIGMTQARESRANNPFNMQTTDEYSNDEDVISTINPFRKNKCVIASSKRREYPSKHMANIAMNIHHLAGFWMSIESLYSYMFQACDSGIPKEANSKNMRKIINFIIDDLKQRGLHTVKHEQNPTSSAETGLYFHKNPMGVHSVALKFGIGDYIGQYDFPKIIAPTAVKAKEKAIKVLDILMGKHANLLGARVDSARFSYKEDPPYEHYAKNPKYAKMNLDDLIDEHKNLLKLLKSSTQAERNIEYDDQLTELKDYIKMRHIKNPKTTKKVGQKKIDYEIDRLYEEYDKGKR